MKKLDQVKQEILQYYKECFEREDNRVPRFVKEDFLETIRNSLPDRFFILRTLKGDTKKFKETFHVNCYRFFFTVLSNEEYKKFEDIFNEGKLLEPKDEEVKKLLQKMLKSYSKRREPVVAGKGSIGSMKNALNSLEKGYVEKKKTKTFKGMPKSNYFEDTFSDWNDLKTPQKQLIKSLFITWEIANKTDYRSELKKIVKEFSKQV